MVGQHSSMRWFRRSTSRTSGYPTSSNGASSMHLWWEPRPTVEEVAVDLEVVAPPQVPRLYFWALQATFTDRTGRRHGGAHLGLQWHPGHPGSTAVNWGGYRPDGAGELAGTTSELPSAMGNLNTRDFEWRPGTPYRLRIHRTDGGWAGEVGGTHVRTLHAGGDRLTGLVVWSEVFARCDDPSTTVRWSGFDPLPDALRPTYQAHGDGGCANTTALPDAGGGVRQVTATDRLVGPGQLIRPGS